MSSRVPPDRASERRTNTAREKSKAFRERQAARARRRRILQWTGGGAAALLAVVVVVVVVVIATASGSDHTPSSDVPPDKAATTNTLTGPPGPEGIVLEEGTPLAPASTSAQGATVDGVQCNSMEQAVYHIHIHLSVYVNGSMRPIPPGIGVVEPVAQQSANGIFDGASRCYYWLHTHAQDGIIHVEAPNQATYNLGNFFDIWHQPLSTTRVGPAVAPVVAYVNGTRYSGNPAAIPMTSHEDIQLDVGTPTVAPFKVDWSRAQL